MERVVICNLHQVLLPWSRGKKEARRLARLEEIRNAYKISLRKAWRHAREDKIGRDLKGHRQAVMVDIKWRVLVSSDDITSVKQCVSQRFYKYVVKGGAST
jgi:hypothetical protein